MKHSVLHPDSVLLFQPAEGGREKQQDLVACVHCGRHWLIGDAIAKAAVGEMGFCARCNGVHCPSAQCAKCVPAEQQIENKEQGLPTHHRPIRLYFPTGFNS